VSFRNVTSTSVDVFWYQLCQPLFESIQKARLFLRDTYFFTQSSLWWRCYNNWLAKSNPCRRSQPEELNGVITGYRLYYMHNNFTDVHTVHASASQMQHTLSSLSKF